MEEWGQFLRGIAAVLWPVVAVVAIVRFQQPVGRLIDRVTKGRIPGVEFEADRVAATAEDAATELSGIIADETVPEALKDRLRRVEATIAELATISDPIYQWYDGMVLSEFEPVPFCEIRPGLVVMDPTRQGSTTGKVIEVKPPDPAHGAVGPSRDEMTPFALIRVAWDDGQIDSIGTLPSAATGFARRRR